MVTLRPRPPKTHKQKTHTSVEEKEEHSQQDDELDTSPEHRFDDDIESEDRAEDDDDEVDVTPTKKRRGKSRPKTNKAAQVAALKQFPKHTGLAERLGKFPAAVDTIVEQWLKVIGTDGPGGVAKILNLVVEAARIDQHEAKSDLVVAGDVLKDRKDKVAADIISAVGDDGPGAPKIMEKKFQKSFGSFWTKCAELAPENLLYDVDAFETVIAWLIEFSGSPARGLRMSASIAAYRLVDGLINVRLALTETISGLERQAKKVTAKSGGKKNKGKASPHSKQLKDKIDSARANAKDLDGLSEDVFRSIFVSRYRDTCAQVRAATIAALGSWILAYPARYLDDTHTKYLGWLLSDKGHTVRGAALDILIRVHSDDEYAAALELFLQRFLPRILQMTKDVDNGVAKRAIDLCTALVKYDVLDERECESVYDLCPQISSSDAVRKAAGHFIAELFRARRAEEGGSPRPTEELRELVFTVLRNGGKEEIHLVMHALWDQLPALSSWQSYIDLLSENHKAQEAGQNLTNVSTPRKEKGRSVVNEKRAASPNKENRENEAQLPSSRADAADDNALTTQEEIILSQLLVAAVRENSNRSSHSRRKLGRNSKAGSNAEDLTLAFAPKLNSLLTHFQSEAEVLESLALLPQYFHLLIFKYHHFENQFKVLLERMGDILLRHTSNYSTLSSAAQTLNFLSKSAHPLQPLASVALSKEASRAAESLDSFVLLGVDKVQDHVAMGSALARTLSLFSVSKPSGRMRKNVLSLLQARVDGAMCLSQKTSGLQCISLAVTIVLWFVADVRPLLVEKKDEALGIASVRDFLQYRQEILQHLVLILKKDRDAIVATKAAIAVYTILTVCAGLSSTVERLGKDEIDLLQGREDVDKHSIGKELKVDVNDFEIGKTVALHLLQLVLNKESQRILAENEKMGDGVNCSALFATLSQAISCGALPGKFSYLPIFGLAMKDVSDSSKLSTAYELAKMFHLRRCSTAEEFQAIKLVGMGDPSSSLEATRNLVTSIGAKYLFAKHDGVERVVERVIRWAHKTESLSPSSAEADEARRWRIAELVCESLIQRIPVAKSSTIIELLESIKEKGEADIDGADTPTMDNFVMAKVDSLTDLFIRHQKGDLRGGRKKPKKVSKATRARANKRRPRVANQYDAESSAESPVRRSARLRKQIDYNEEGLVKARLPTRSSSEDLEKLPNENQGSPAAEDDEPMIGNGDVDEPMINGNNMDKPIASDCEEDEESLETSSKGANKSEVQDAGEGSGTHSSKRCFDGTPKSQETETPDTGKDSDIFGDHALSTPQASEEPSPKRRKLKGEENKWTEENDVKSVDEDSQSMSSLENHSMSNGFTNRERQATPTMNEKKTNAKNRKRKTGKGQKKSVPETRHTSIAKATVHNGTRNDLMTVKPIITRKRRRRL